MELVNVQLGRAVWLFDTQELNPRGIALYPDFYIAANKRYQFATAPKAENIHAGESLYFKEGKFPYELTTVAVDLELHSDGLVANTRHSTEAANAFLQDLVGWCGEHLGVSYPPSLGKKRIYRSELIVNMNPKLASVATKLQNFASILSEIVKKETQVTGLDFGAQESTQVFHLARRANSPFDDNQYFTKGWFQTLEHIELLSKFEAIMTETEN